MEKVDTSQQQRVKPYWRAAIAGAISALAGVFAYCVYHAYTHLHKDICSCAKFGAMIVAAFSHPIAIAGALAGVSVISAVYLVRHLYRHFHQSRKHSPESRKRPDPKRPLAQ